MSTTTCDHPMRDGGCAMKPDHRGRHSTVAFYCDGCGQTRRGTPHAANEDIALCFMCNGEPFRWEREARMLDEIYADHA